MKYIKTLKMDIDKRNFEVIPSVQFDNTRFLHIYLLNNSVPFNLTGCSVKVSGIKPDGSAIFNNCTIINAKEGFVEVELTEQMNAASGTLKCELKLYSGSGVLTTKQFLIEITSSVTSKNITSSNEFKALTDALDKVNNIDAKFESLTEEAVKEATTLEIQKQIASGNLANLTIADGSITTNKLKDQSVTVGKIADNSITPNKFANMCDYYKSTIISNNTIVDFGTGNTSTLNGYECTDFIPINNGDIIKIADGKISKLAVIYDSSKKAIQDISGASTNGEFVLTINKENASYIRININKSSPYYSNFYIKNNIDKITLNWLEIGLSNLDSQIRKSFNDDGKINPENIVGSIGNLSLFKKDKCIIDKVIDNSGNVVNAPNYTISPGTYCVTDFIKVTPSTDITFNWDSIMTFCGEYNSEKKLVKMNTGNSGQNPRVVTLSQTTEYIRINLKIEILDTFTITGGGKLTFDWLEDILSEKLGNFTPNQSSGNSHVGKTVLVTGDSITEKNNTSTKVWHEYLIDWLGFKEVKNDAVGGTGLVRNNGLIKRIPNWKTKYGNDIDMILIMGCMNDGALDESWNRSWIGTFKDGEDDAKKDQSLYGALHYCFKEILKMYPNTPIGFIISQPRNDMPTRGLCWGKNSWFEDWVTVIKEVCGHYSIPCLDLYHESGLRPWIQENNQKYFYNLDGKHPNALGHEVLAKKINMFVQQYM